MIQVLEPATVSLVTERRVSQPRELAGGAPGAFSENCLWPGADETQRVPLVDKVTVQMSAGDTISVTYVRGGSTHTVHVKLGTRPS